MKKVLRIVSLFVFVSGIGLAIAPSALTADTCTAGDGSTCSCKGTCSAGPAECHCNPPDK
jgi:hypothetical protein